jgi:shikimate dehydrogenase
MDVYGLLGNPVGHSLSPPMHEAAYDAVGLDARYVTFEPPKDAAVAAVESARTLGVAGLNVTIPFKQDALAAVEADPLAARIGAVNTIGLPAPGSDDPPTGYNTDAEGARRALREHGVALEGLAVVVGAGGAGRAVAFALADAGMTVAVANRTAEKARRLAGEVAAANGAGDDAVDGDDASDGETTRAGGTDLDDRDLGESDATATDLLDGTVVASGHGLDALPELVGDADVLVNATSVGMEEDRSPVPADALHADLAVLDAVYQPVETRLLEDAAAAGARTVDGAWMLLYQGAAAFEQWTGRDAPIEAMNDALRARL